MTIVTIQTPRGAHLGLRKDDTQITTGEAKQLFVLETLEDKVTLMPLASPGLRVQAEGGGGGPLAASSGEAGWQARFTLAEENGTATFRAPDGVHYLSEADDGTLTLSATSVGPDERFVLTRHDARVAAGGHCCGHRRAVLSDEPEPAWEDETHKGIVIKAHDLMNPHGREFPEAAHAAGNLNNPHIRDFLFKGLYDADYLTEYTDWDYSPHFYDPDFEGNFRRPWPSANPNAQTEGARFLHLSAAMLANVLWKVDRQIDVDVEDYNRCGYLLGLACHFLTDLTQPMHAANFANLVGQGWPGPPIWVDRRHTDFEKNAERQVKAGYLEDVPWLPRETFLIPPGTRPFDLLHETAVKAKAVFNKYLAPLVPRKLRYEPRLRTWVMIPFTDEEVRTVLDQTLKGPSLQAAARFFTLWWRIANQQRQGVVTPGRWYRIKEPTRDEHVGYKGSYIQRWKLDPNGEEFLHTFRRNRDGSYAIVCKAQQDRVWTIETTGIWQLGAVVLGPPAGTSPKQRFVPVADGDHVWLFSFDRYEPLRVREALDWDGHLVRWTPDVSRPHLFSLEDAGPLSDADAANLEGLTDG